MYGAAHLDAYVRLLTSHLERLIDLGNELIETDAGNMPLNGDGLSWDDAAMALALNRDREAMFIEQMEQARQWAECLGALDAPIERRMDEFLIDSHQLESLRLGQSGGRDESLDDESLQHANPGLLDGIDMTAMLDALFSLLASLEERYEISARLDDEPAAASSQAFAAPGGGHGARILSLPSAIGRKT